ncbi:hypothetical protein C8Q76DRAFT_737946 [Earliella scabrosa]|nr:hypothetical protein C8Q76DRAFT_737946 [Earliella scabrosa]
MECCSPFRGALWRLGMALWGGSALGRASRVPGPSSLPCVPSLSTTELHRAGCGCNLTECMRFIQVASSPISSR